MNGAEPGVGDLADTVAVIVPVLRRPHRAAPLFDSFAAATPLGRLVFICSPDDLAERDACLAVPDADVIVTNWPGGTPGDWAKKINLGYRHTTQPWLLCGADDLVFHHSWFENALAAVGGDGAKIGVVGTNDLANPRVTARKHSTHPLVARWYADRVGTLPWDTGGGKMGGGAGHVVVECYSHNFVDNEVVGYAKAMRAWRFAERSWVEHQHPSWGTAPSDAVYTLGRAGWDRDRALHRSRARMWEDRRLAQRTKRR